MFCHTCPSPFKPENTHLFCNAILSKLFKFSSKHQNQDRGSDYDEVEDCGKLLKDCSKWTLTLSSQVDINVKQQVKAAAFGAEMEIDGKNPSEGRKPRLGQSFNYQMVKN